jgi:UDP-N-acetylmuramate dehydrogenase
MTKNAGLLKIELEKIGFVPKTDEPLAKHTTWKIGGPAELFVHSKNAIELEKVARLSKLHEVPLTILGWGSNVLISDKGLKGLVVKNTSNTVTILGEAHQDVLVDRSIEARLESVDKEGYYDFDDLDYDESNEPIIKVRVDSGVYVPYLINVLIDKGITGLQWFAGIPGTVGGAIYNNIHGGKRFFSEVVDTVTFLDELGNVKTLNNNDLQFDYDFSIFHNTKDIILTSELNLHRGDKDRARNTSIAWATRKRLQPSNSAGCCFQNIEKTTQDKLKLESSSWGYIIDKVLGLKGYSVGKATISSKHAAFIETQVGATASDVLHIFDKIYSESEKKLSIVPITEIFFMGFEEGEVAKYNN